MRVSLFHLRSLYVSLLCFTLDTFREDWRKGRWFFVALCVVNFVFMTLGLVRTFGRRRRPRP